MRLFQETLERFAKMLASDFKMRMLVAMALIMVRAFLAVSRKMPFSLLDVLKTRVNGFLLAFRLGLASEPV